MYEGVSCEGAEAEGVDTGAVGPRLAGDDGECVYLFLCSSFSGTDWDYRYVVAEKPQKARDLLGPDETIINPHYMKQLLKYGISIGMENPDALNSRDLDGDAVVRGIDYLFYDACAKLISCLPP